MGKIGEGKTGIVERFNEMQSVVMWKYLMKS
jgi:hypothetical protein